MAKRDGNTINFIWVHLRLSRSQIADFEARSKTLTDSTKGLEGVRLSVNFNITGDEALIKVPASKSWIDGLPRALKKKVIRIYTERDHSEAAAMLDTEAWRGPLTDDDL